MSLVSVFKKKNEKVTAEKEILQDENLEQPLEPQDIDDNVVYAELDLPAHHPGPAVRVRAEDDKTEYAEIIHTQPPTK